MGVLWAIWLNVWSKGASALCRVVHAIPETATAKPASSCTYTAVLLPGMQVCGLSNSLIPREMRKLQVLGSVRKSEHLILVCEESASFARVVKETQYFQI